MSTESDHQRELLQRIAKDDPKLAARLILMTLPAAASRIHGTLAWVLDLEGMGSHLITVSGGRARVDDGEREEDVDFRLSTDAATLVELIAGRSGPLGLMLSGRIRIRGKRRRALRLRAMSSAEVGLDEVAAAGGRIDPDVIYSSLPYLVDPEWTRGHTFSVRYDLPGEGSWQVQVRDGQPLLVTRDQPDAAPPVAVVRVEPGAYQRMVSGQLSPTQAMQRGLTDIEGQIYPVTLLGRWIDRGQGSDQAEQKREERQRRVQAERAHLWSPAGSGAGQGPGQGDPGHDSESRAREAGGLLDPRQLYALWERQNWSAHELDFELDKEQWVTTPRAAQESTTWMVGSFYVGEERVTADLAPFLLAAPSGEVEIFLATQLVDEARHAVFFDRFGAEVMALSAPDLRGRMHEVEAQLAAPWRDVFDDGLRDVANRIKARPDDLDLFVEGIATYHMIVEGFLAVTGQTLIRDYLQEHGLYPGFCEGFGLVERDEHRHVAFGVRFLRDAIDQDPRHRATVERVVLDLAPRAALVFVPPYADDASEFVSYGYTSRQIYGLAYRTLKRRMKVLGIEIPSAAELMPGPIEEARALGAPASSAPSPEAGSNGGASSNGHGDLDSQELAAREP